MKIFIILDLEATCFDKTEQKPKGFQNEIIEIGAVKCNNEGTPISEFQSFVKPIKFPQLSKFCKELTTIIQDNVDYADSFPIVLEKFKQWAIDKQKMDQEPNDITWISWGKYDLRQLRDDCQLHKIDKEWINENNHRSLKHLHAVWNKLKPKGIGMNGALVNSF